MQSRGVSAVDGKMEFTLSNDSELISSKAQDPFAILVPFPTVFETEELLMIRTSAQAC